MAAAASVDFVCGSAYFIPMRRNAACYNPSNQIIFAIVQPHWLLFIAIESYSHLRAKARVERLSITFGIIIL